MSKYRKLENKSVEGREDEYSMIGEFRANSLK